MIEGQEGGGRRATSRGGDGGGDGRRQRCYNCIPFEQEGDVRLLLPALLVVVVVSVILGVFSALHPSFR